MSENVVFNPTCSGCGNRMGEMSGEEFSALVMAEGLEAKCFDCDHVGSSKYEESLCRCFVGDVTVIDGKEFWLNRNIEGDLCWRTISRKEKLGDSLSCLSSSTKLNILGKTDSQDTVFFSEFFTCPECAGDYLFLDKHGWQCSICGFFAVPSEQYFGPWPPITPSTCLGEIRQSTIDCWDCLYVRRNEHREYCSYHHALLVEQFEDGSIGYGHAR